MPARHITRPTPSARGTEIAAGPAAATISARPRDAAPAKPDPIRTRRDDRSDRRPRTKDDGREADNEPRTSAPSRLAAFAPVSRAPGPMCSGQVRGSRPTSESGTKAPPLAAPGRDAPAKTTPGPDVRHTSSEPTWDRGGHRPPCCQYIPPRGDRRSEVPSSAPDPSNHLTVRDPDRDDRQAKGPWVFQFPFVLSFP